MEFQTFSKCHVRKLLDFEIKNKEWFETLIEPRVQNFYSNRGVAEHIDGLIQQMNSGTAFSGVVMKGGAVVARANLKDISNNKAYVGYRVAKDFTSQGIGSYCLFQLLDMAQYKFNLKQLKAQVLDNNPALIRILKKRGFITMTTTPNFLALNNKSLACTELELKLA